MEHENPYASPRAGPPLEVTHLEPPQAITVAPQVGDYLAYWDYCYANSPGFRAELRGRLGTTLTIGGSVLALGLFLYWSPAQFLGVGFVVLGLVIVLGAALRVPARKQAARNAYRQAALHSLSHAQTNQITIRLLHDRLRLENRSGNSEYYWRFIEGVHSTEEHLILVLDTDSHISIAMRDFDVAATFLGWCELVERLVEQARMDRSVTAQETEEAAAEE